MKFFDGIKNTFGNDQDSYTNDDQGYDYQPAENEQNFNQGGIGLSSTALELKVVKPESFNNVTQIADHLLNRRTVVLNLESTNKEAARRLIDFLSGVAYSIDGTMKRVANNTFVITPDNVDVSGEQISDQNSAKSANPSEKTEDLYGSL